MIAIQKQTNYICSQRVKEISRNGPDWGRSFLL